MVAQALKESEFRLSIQMWYCWWLRNPANMRLVVYSIIFRGLYIPAGEGFLPSTVSSTMIHIGLMFINFTYLKKIRLPGVQKTSKNHWCLVKLDSLPPLRWKEEGRLERLQKKHQSTGRLAMETQHKMPPNSCYLFFSKDTNSKVPVTLMAGFFRSSGEKILGQSEFETLFGMKFTTSTCDTPMNE